MMDEYRYLAGESEYSQAYGDDAGDANDQALEEKTEVLCRHVGPSSSGSYLEKCTKTK